ncbi:MAG TPA: hypothetical protein VEC57_10055 [Candidatus Limnocylindrales bacterium]|nr:hypothetical protein [Candidatus Limnocylindrales bacterium]
MKRGLLSITMAGALCSAASIAFAGAYGPGDEPEERPLPPPAPAAREVVEEEEEVQVVRRWEGFATDAETSRGLWIEVGTLYGQEDDIVGSGDDEFFDTELRIAYGQEMFEAGAEISYQYYHFDNLPGDNDVDDFSDLEFWAKVIPLRTDFMSLGGGIAVSAPIGGSPFDGTHRLPVHGFGQSDDEWGFDPFVTAGFAAGPVQIRTSIGYMMFTDNNDLDAIDYNAAILAPIGEMIVVRAEVQGYHLTDDNHPNNLDDPVAVLPGVDIRVPLGGGEFLIRPTGLVGLDNEASDWGVGVSLAFTGIGG